MATVTGITVERAQEIEDASVISGSISSAGHLLLYKAGGEVVDAGAVVPSPLQAWPIGSIYMGISNANPSTLLGGGSWVRWGQGRMPVSQDDSQTEFDTAQETGGSKTTTLTLAQMPVHRHGVGTLVNSSPGGHSHNINRRVAVGEGGGVAHGGGVLADDDTTGLSGNHTHTISGETADAGAGAAQTNLPPYIVVYMWRRTA